MMIVIGSKSTNVIATLSIQVQCPKPHQCPFAGSSTVVSDIGRRERNEVQQREGKVGEETRAIYSTIENSSPKLPESPNTGRDGLDGERE